MFKALVKLANGLVSFAVGLSLLVAGLYAGYCLWDNRQIYAAAENVQSELLHLKPKAVEEAGETGPAFDDLILINPDVCAWISMDNTNIDYPVLQGASNMDYINRDVYGKFALAGSIFLDSRNDMSFTDNYSVLYGHHMQNSAMFGDLDKYKDRKFFEENEAGTLLVPGKSYSLNVLAYIQTRANDDFIFDPEACAKDASGLLEYAKAESVYSRPEAIDSLMTQLSVGERVQLLALTTCSSEFTDARTIVLTAMNEYRQEESGDTRQ